MMLERRSFEVIYLCIMPPIRLLQSVASDRRVHTSTSKDRTKAKRLRRFHCVGCDAVFERPSTLRQVSPILVANRELGADVHCHPSICSRIRAKNVSIIFGLYSNY
jgi:hypothetical protein